MNKEDYPLCKEERRYNIIGFSLSFTLNIAFIVIVYLGFPFWNTSSVNKNLEMIPIKLLIKDRLVQPKKEEVNKQKSLDLIASKQNSHTIQSVREEDYLKNMDLPIEKIDFIKIKHLLYFKLIYPAIAQRNNWGGVVQIALTINTKGELIRFRISNSSGKMILDDAVSFAAKQLQAVQLPKPKQPCTVVFNVSFSTKG